ARLDGLVAAGVEGVEALATPVVVGLVGRDGQLIDQRRRAAVVTHDEDHVADIAAGRRHLDQVNSRGPRRRRLQRVGDGPVRGDHAGGWVRRRHGLVLAGQVGDGTHQRRAGAGVPADAVDVEVVVGLRGADIEGDRLTVVDAGRGGVAADHGVGPAVRAAGRGLINGIVAEIAVGAVALLLILVRLVRIMLRRLLAV